MTRSDPCFTPVKTVLIARVLGYGGALPFLCGAIAASQQMAVLGLAPAHLLLSYGAVILSFLGGLHWGRVITSPNANGSIGSSACTAASSWALPPCTFSGGGKSYSAASAGLADAPKLTGISLVFFCCRCCVHPPFLIGGPGT